MLPITALHRLSGTDGLCCYAQGSRLVIRNNDRILAESTELFDHDYIHGIRSGFADHEFLVYGACCSNRVAIDADIGTVEVLENLPKTIDRILDGKLLRNETVFLCAHNQFVVMREGNDTCVVDVIASEENGIVYCGVISGDIVEDVVCISGTAFGEILLWKPTHSKKPERKLQGHRGPVFDLYFDSVRGLLLSVSDDRSLRVWRLANSSYTCLHELYGHEARPWSVRAVGDYALSVGEDGFACLWNIELGQLCHRQIFENGSIRRCSVGADSKQYVSGTLGFDSGSVLHVDLPKQCANLVVLKELTRKIFVTNIALLKNGRIFLTTNDGTIYFLSPGHVCLLYQHSDLRNCLLSHNESDNSVLVCGKTGHCVMIKDESGTGKFITVNVLQLPSMFPSIHVFCDVFRCETDRFVIATLDCRLFLRSKSSPATLRTFQLPSSGKHRIPSAVIEWRGLLVVGDQTGGMHWFGLANAETLDHRLLAPSTSLPHCHGPNGVTDLHTNGTLLLSLGRDGIQRTWDLDGAEVVEIEKVQLSNRLEWPARFLKCSLGLLIAGFSGTRFCVYHPALQTFLVSLECGGGHRSWSCRLDVANQTLYFAHTRAGQLVHCKVLLPRIREFTMSPHSRKITAIMSLGIGSGFVTAAEDTKLVVWGAQCSAQQVLRRHISSVHCLQHIQTGVFVSAGGRGQICVWKVGSDKLYRVTVDYSIEKDVRLLSVVMLGSVLWIACSDGVIRLFTYTATRHSITPFLSSDPIQTCPLVMKQLRKDSVILGCTDGSLRSASLLESEPATVAISEPILKCDSGVMCLYVVNNTTGETVLCGCESGDIVVAFLKDNLMHSSYILSYHSSSVTAILVINSSEFVATSIDQRVSKWRLQDCVTRPVFGSAQYMHVADAAGAIVCDNSLTICGYGIENVTL